MDLQAQAAQRQVNVQFAAPLRDSEREQRRSPAIQTEKVWPESALASARQCVYVPRSCFGFALDITYRRSARIRRWLGQMVDTQKILDLPLVGRNTLARLSLDTHVYAVGSGNDIGRTSPARQHSMISALTSRSLRGTTMVLDAQ